MSLGLSVANIASMRFPLILLSLYLAVFGICAIEPYDRGVWLAENAPIWIIVGLIAWASRYHRFSNLAYSLMFILPVLHTIGGHYTFERVPFDWFTDTFGFERNHYDRIAHITVGFFAFPMAEVAVSKQLVKPRWLLLTLPVMVILGIAGAYEIFEWLYAVTGNPEAGSAVLGSQGDVWDAQKDMLADTIGAIFAVVLFVFFGKRHRGECLRKAHQKTLRHHQQHSARFD